MAFVAVSVWDFFLLFKLLNTLIKLNHLGYSVSLNSLVFFRSRTDWTITRKNYCLVISLTRTWCYPVRCLTSRDSNCLQGGDVGYQGNIICLILFQSFESSRLKLDNSKNWSRFCEKSLNAVDFVLSLHNVF